MLNLFFRQWFFYLYTIAIIPSYLLPWLGSNSFIAHLFSNHSRAAFWIHTASLSLACFFSFIRGKQIKASHLGGLSISAAFFDLMPILNFIPLIPSFFHLLTILIGTKTNIRLNLSDKITYR